MPVTLKDVAEKAGFSITTVSRALGGYDDVSEATRAHIKTVAEALGYEPNVVARQLQGRRTNTIGLVIPAERPDDAEDDFFSLLIKGISQSAARLHHDLLISTLLPGDDELATYRRLVGGSRVDGVIVARTVYDDARIAYLKQMRHPFVVSGRLAPDQDSDFPYIDADSRTGLRLLVMHLAGLGHRHIGLILPPALLAYTPYRLQGYRDGLAAVGLSYRSDYTVSGDLTRRGGYVAAQHLLDTLPQLTALIACNDLMAFGAIDAIRARGLEPGADIALGGFDDIPGARHSSPTLTTIRQPIYRIGEQLAGMLVQLIDGHAPEDRQILLEPELIVRESSGPSRRASG